MTECGRIATYYGVSLFKSGFGILFEKTNGVKAPGFWELDGKWFLGQNR